MCVWGCVVVHCGCAGVVCVVICEVNRCGHGLDVVGLEARLGYCRLCAGGWLVLGYVGAGISCNVHDPSKLVERQLV